MGRKHGVVQIGLEILNQGLKMTISMVVRDGSTRKVDILQVTR
jgi:hypothetical protein